MEDSSCQHCDCWLEGGACCYCQGYTCDANYDDIHTEWDEDDDDE